ncbi:MAG: phosphodiester glycosidase family protein [Cyanobium sp.]
MTSGTAASFAPRLQAPPPPPPALDSPESGPRYRRPAAIQPIPAGATGSQQGRRLRINGRPQQAAWLRLPAGPGQGEQLWLPLEVLQAQLGFNSSSRSDGSLALGWYGQELIVPTSGQRSLGDEVAVDVAGLLEAVGVSVSNGGGDTLELQLAPARLLQVRAARQPGQRRIVLDLDAPAVVRSSEEGLDLGLWSSSAQQADLAQRGLGVRQAPQGLVLTTASGTRLSRILTLANPSRVVIDLPGEGPEPNTKPGPARFDPRLLALLGKDLRWDRQVLRLGSLSFRLNRVSLDPRSGPLELQPLSRSGGMEGLSSLTDLAQRADALVAINGGFFNRVRRLPLGALRQQGRWLSGPILNRGAVGWESRNLPRFGRLQLQEWLLDRNGQRWPIQVLNSGYVQRGISRYTSDWGPWYRALSNGETGLLLRNGMVQQRFDAARLTAGVALAPGDMVLVGRAGAELPWQEGEPLTLDSRPSDPVGLAANVLGGGPLLLLKGRIVLSGAAEGFGAAFLSQGAPRTVIGTDGTRIELITLEGVEQEGPTLAETAMLLQGLGLRDALNLDGGSSTGLVMGGAHTVKGRGVAGAVHNGLGLVPNGDQADRTGASSAARSSRLAGS